MPYAVYSLYPVTYTLYTIYIIPLPPQGAVFPRRMVKASHLCRVVPLSCDTDSAAVFCAARDHQAPHRGTPHSRFHLVQTHTSYTLPYLLYFLLFLLKKRRHTRMLRRADKP